MCPGNRTILPSCCTARAVVCLSWYSEECVCDTVQLQFVGPFVAHRWDCHTSKFYSCFAYRSGEIRVYEYLSALTVTNISVYQLFPKMDQAVCLVTLLAESFHACRSDSDPIDHSAFWRYQANFRSTTKNLICSGKKSQWNPCIASLCSELRTSVLHKTENRRLGTCLAFQHYCFPDPKNCLIQLQQISSKKFMSWSLWMDLS